MLSGRPNQRNVLKTGNQISDIGKYLWPKETENRASGRVSHQHKFQTESVLQRLPQGRLRGRFPDPPLTHPSRDLGMGTGYGDPRDQHHSELLQVVRGGQIEFAWCRHIRHFGHHSFSNVYYCHCYY